MPKVAFIDVDDTLIRSVGTKRIPIPAAIAKVRSLADEGYALYCWSSGGGDYARASATEVGLEKLFLQFLPKPTLMLDDQPVQDWRGLEYIHPAQL